MDPFTTLLDLRSGALEPGRVCDEFLMTKGRFHAKRGRAEIYLGLAGEGADGRPEVVPNPRYRG